MVCFNAGFGQAHDLKRLCNDIAHGHAGAKGGVGVLKDQLRAFAKKQISVWLANAAINMANESTSQRQMFIDRCAGVAG